MSKELKSFEIIKKMYKYFVKKYRDLEPKLMICEKEDFDNVENALKALEIINKTVMKLVSLEDDTTICSKGRYAVYDSELYCNKELTKEEYELLKEICYD